MEKLLEKLDSLLQHVTGKRVFLVLMLGLGLLFLYTAFEQRHVLYSKADLMSTNGDYVITAPSPVGQKLLKDLIAKYPNIAMITIIDADPVTNRRVPVARVFGNKEIQRLFEDVLAKNPKAGEGPLITADANNNAQVYAIMNGEFQCAPNKNTILSNNFPGSDKLVTYSCRVPLPPAFGKATGWFTLQLSTWPEERIESLKVDALSMSLQYYSTEILKTGPVVPKDA
jgi:hypothetical protein